MGNKDNKIKTPDVRKTKQDRYCGECNGIITFKEHMKIKDLTFIEAEFSWKHSHFLICDECMKNIKKFGYPIKVKKNNEELISITGWISLITTTISALWIAFFGECIYPWLIYIVASITGVINNKLTGNKKMTIIFIIFFIGNLFALMRLTLL